jgi:hypothetical protein
MMLKVLPLTALALGLSSGAAFADRHGGDHRGGDSHRGGSVVVRDHGGNRGGSVVVRDRGGYRGNRGNTVVVRDHGFRGNNVVVRDHGFRGNNRVIVRGDGRFHGVRRPIYVSRPVIHHRYFNYYQRPAVIFESYNTMPGYYWVPGHWEWSGYEWTWQPGHYQPDPNYIDPGYGYGYGYDSGL